MTHGKLVYSRSSLFWLMSGQFNSIQSYSFFLLCEAYCRSIWMSTTQIWQSQLVLKSVRKRINNVSQFWRSSIFQGSQAELFSWKKIHSVSGWADFATQALPRIPHKTRKIDDEIIVINVSGVRYMCWKSTLEVSENELLTRGERFEFDRL